jgi:hypothetical protein
LPKRVDYIKLLEPCQPVEGVDRAAVQGTLFKISSNYLLLFLDISSISDSLFLNILKGGMLRTFDLRVAPRFDIGSLTRARVFELFKQHQIDYFDIPGSLSVSSMYDVRLNPESIAPFIFSKIREHKIPGPNLFLFENEKRASEFATLLPRALPAPAKHTWEILLLKENPFTDALLPNLGMNHKRGRSKRLGKRFE